MELISLYFSVKKLSRRNPLRRRKVIIAKNQLSKKVMMVMKKEENWTIFLIHPKSTFSSCIFFIFRVFSKTSVILNFLHSYSVSDHEAKVDKELKGVDEEDALRTLLTSDEEEEEENEEKKNEERNKSDNDEPSPNEDTSASTSANKKKRKKESPAKPGSDVKKEGEFGCSVSISVD